MGKGSGPCCSGEEKKVTHNDAEATGDSTVNDSVPASLTKNPAGKKESAHTKMAAITQPGRLGNPAMTLGEDPRTHPAMVAMLAPLQMTGAPAKTVDLSNSLEEVHGFVAMSEPMIGPAFGMFFAGLDEVSGVKHHEGVIKGVDGNDIKLYTTSPADHDGSSPPLPCIVHLHGGGLIQGSTRDVIYTRWCDNLVKSGVMVVQVEFRNASGALGPFPFPAGLNDCCSAVQWIHDNRKTISISSIVLMGESGGGNLTLATCLKKVKDEQSEQIQGCYAMCPYIYGNYQDKIAELPSLTECDGYFLDISGSVASTCRLYTPNEEDKKNPLAWPYWATEDECKGLPPTFISVNEIDPLRDEGLAYARKLARAGVSVTSSTVNGVAHACQMGLEKIAPGIHSASLRSIVGFAKSL